MSPSFSTLPLSIVARQPAVSPTKRRRASVNTVPVPQHTSVSAPTSAKVPPTLRHCSLQSESGLTESASAKVAIINSADLTQPVISVLQMACQVLLESAILELVCAIRANYYSPNFTLLLDKPYN